jgi:hypothetical protein
MFQTKVVEKIKKHILFFRTFFLFKNSAVCEVMWKNMAEPHKQQVTIIIIAFPL